MGSRHTKACYPGARRDLGAAHGLHKFNLMLLVVENGCRITFPDQNHRGEFPMRSLALLERLAVLAFCALFVAGCEGPNWSRDNAGGTIRRDDWTAIEPTQLTGNLPEVLAGLQLQDAKRALRDNAVQHDNVTITGRGWASAQRMIAPYSYFGEHSFTGLNSREYFEKWARGRFPQAKEVEFTDVIRVTHPTTTTRGFAATVTVTNSEDRKFRCSLAYAGYGGPKLSETSTDIFRMEELKSILQVRLCSSGATAASLNQRMQRTMF